MPDRRFVRVTVRRTMLETYVIDRATLEARFWLIPDVTSDVELGDYFLDEIEEIDSGGLPFVRKLDELTDTQDPEIAEIALDGRLEPIHEVEPDARCEQCDTPTWGVVNDDEPICADCWAKTSLHSFAAALSPGDQDA